MNQSLPMTAAPNADTPPNEHLSFIFKNQKVIKNLNKQIAKAENNAISAYFVADKAFRVHYHCALPRGEEAVRDFFENMDTNIFLQTKVLVEFNLPLRIASAIAPFYSRIWESKIMRSAINKVRDSSLARDDEHCQRVCTLVEDYVESLRLLTELYEERSRINQLAIQEVNECAAVAELVEEIEEN